MALHQCTFDNKQFVRGSPNDVTWAHYYLFMYNAVQFVGWWKLTEWTLRDLFLDPEGPRNALAMAWSRYGFYVWVLQWIVFLDILHLGVGFIKTRSNVGVWMTVHCKVLRRMQFLLSLNFYVPEAQHHFSMGLTLLSWALVDIIRYSFYGLKSIKRCPTWLVYLRYSEFIVLYPLGMIAEFWLWFVMIEEALTRTTTDFMFPFIYYLSYAYTAYIVCYLIWRLQKFPNNYGKMVEEFRKH